MFLLLRIRRISKHHPCSFLITSAENELHESLTDLDLSSSTCLKACCTHKILVQLHLSLHFPAFPPQTFCCSGIQAILFAFDLLIFGFAKSNINVSQTTRDVRMWVNDCFPITTLWSVTMLLSFCHWLIDHSLYNFRTILSGSPRPC